MVRNWVRAGIDGWIGASGITIGTLLGSIKKAERIWGAGFTGCETTPMAVTSLPCIFV
jgi:hypothetical protein